MLVEFTNIRIGDRVRIKNPKPGQQNKGTEQGLTATGFVKILTTNGNIIRRVPNNIVKIAL